MVENAPNRPVALGEVCARGRGGGYLMLSQVPHGAAARPWCRARLQAVSAGPVV